MSQAVALFIVADEFANNAETSSAHHYYLGVRDVLDAIIRGCHEVPDGEPLRGHLEGLLGEDREALLEQARTVLRARRRASVAETLAVV